MGKSGAKGSKSCRPDYRRSLANASHHAGVPCGSGEYPAPRPTILTTMPHGCYRTGSGARLHGVWGFAVIWCVSYAAGACYQPSGMPYTAVCWMRMILPASPSGSVACTWNRPEVMTSWHSCLRWSRSAMYAARSKPRHVPVSAMMQGCSLWSQRFDMYHVLTVVDLLKLDRPNVNTSPVLSDRMESPAGTHIPR